VLAIVSKFSQSFWLQHLQVSSSHDTVEDGVSGMLLDSQSCSDSSMEGKKALFEVSIVVAEVLVVSVFTVMLDNEGKVLALLLTRVRGLCLLRDMFIKERRRREREKREKERKKRLVQKRMEYTKKIHHHHDPQHRHSERPWQLDFSIYTHMYRRITYISSTHLGKQTDEKKCFNLPPRHTHTDGGMKNDISQWYHTKIRICEAFHKSDIKIRHHPLPP